MYLIERSFYHIMLTKLDHPIVGTKYSLVQKMFYLHSRLHGDRKNLTLKRGTYIHICKAKSPKVSFFFALNFLPWEFLFVQKLEIEKN